MTTSTATLTLGPANSPIVLPVRKLTTEEYLQMIDAGMWENGERVELLEGYIVPMAPGGPEHGYAFLNLADIFKPATPQFRLGIQITLNLSPGNVFDPDLMLLKQRESLKTSLPRPDDVVLLIESAHSSLRHDQQVKLPLYAAAGIPEYWILDLKAKRLLVHRDPMGEAYQDERTLGVNDSIAPLALPQMTIKVADFFA
jgi:Uma2 family endonuclease